MDIIKVAGNSRTSAVAGAIAVRRVGFDSVDENPVEIIDVIVNEFSSRPHFLPGNGRIEYISKPDARHASTNKNNGLGAGEFFVELNGIAVEIIDGEVVDGVIYIVTARHVHVIAVVNDVVYGRGVSRLFGQTKIPILSNGEGKSQSS